MSIKSHQILTCFCLCSAICSLSGVDELQAESSQITRSVSMKTIKRKMKRIWHNSYCRSMRKNLDPSPGCDLDHDFLKDSQELRKGTDIFDADTDKDGLLDGLELRVFGTDPLDSDSDDDGILDGNDDVNSNSISDEDEDDRPSEGSTQEDLDDSDPGQSTGNGGGSGSGSGNCQLSPYDQAGNTSEFSISQGLTGNISAGQQLYSLTCSGCHSGIDKGANLDFIALHAAVTGPPMFINSLSNQNFADLVAYLNRLQDTGVYECTLNPGPTPDPTASPSPTPQLSDEELGAIIYSATCSSCHSNVNELRDTTLPKLNEALSDIDEMSGINLSNDQKQLLLMYLRSL